MGKTYKNSYACRGRYFRRMSGRKRAMINNARKGAIPPDPWDDYSLCRSNWAPQRMVREMAKANKWTREEMIHKVMKKFKLKHADAAEIVSWELRIRVYWWL